MISVFFCNQWTADNLIQELLQLQECCQQSPIKNPVRDRCIGMYKINLDWYCRMFLCPHFAETLKAVRQLLSLAGTSVHHLVSA